MTLAGDVNKAFLGVCLRLLCGVGCRFGCVWAWGEVRNLCLNLFLGFFSGLGQVWLSRLWFLLEDRYLGSSLRLGCPLAPELMRCREIIHVVLLPKQLFMRVLHDFLNISEDVFPGKKAPFREADSRVNARDFVELSLFLLGFFVDHEPLLSLRNPLVFPRFPSHIHRKLIDAFWGGPECLIPEPGLS